MHQAVYPGSTINSFFNFRDVNTDLINCPLNAFLVSDNNANVNRPLTGFLEDPVVNTVDASGDAIDWNITPTDINLETKYYFYVQISDANRTNYVGGYSLDVGCSFQTITRSPSNYYVVTDTIDYLG